MRWRRARIGWLLPILLLSGCGARGAGALYPQLVEHEGERIDNVLFTGAEPFRADSLLRLLATQPSRCNFLGIPVCVPFTRLGRNEHHLNAQRVQSDLETLERVYRIAGYFGTRVTPDVQPDADPDNVDITFVIQRGDPVVLDRFEVVGTDGVVNADSLEQRLPIKVGEVFHLGRYLAASDSVLGALQRRGHAYAEILRSFTVDTIDNRAEASLEARPGPQVTIDSIMIVGAENLGRATVMRQLEFSQGELLRSSALAQSQRNLYALELVSLASVNVAPDSLQRVPGDSTRATVLITVAEAEVNQIEAAVGFGTVECLRAETQWINRSFFGGARRLALHGAMSRLGVGEPFAIGGGDNICRAFRADTAFGGTHFDYRFSADFSQPYFVGPRNQLGLNLFAERLSEPGIFQRRAVGGRVALSRRLSLRSNAGFGVDAERGLTRASPALFCASFLICEPELIDSLALPRFRVELGANVFREDTDNRLDPAHGSVFRSAIAWAPVWLGSDVTFLRWTGEGTLYRRLRPGTVAAFALRLGNFFRTASLDPTMDFLPPEERFFAGGATSVRGFERNGLGPGVYVADSVVVDQAGDTVPFSDNPRFVATGGTALAVLSAELRMPSPLLRDRLRLVVFVDGGSIGTGSLWDVGLLDMKFTPGIGFRMQTPVGPVRFDAAYNPHRLPAGPLLYEDDETGLIRRVNDDFRPDRRGFFSRLRLHVGIGHAF